MTWLCIQSQREERKRALARVSRAGIRGKTCCNYIEAIRDIAGILIPTVIIPAMGTWRIGKLLAGFWPEAFKGSFERNLA